MFLWFILANMVLTIYCFECFICNYRDAAYYLCGHLHTLAGLLTRMYSRHNTGTIELELGDWRDNRL